MAQGTCTIEGCNKPAVYVTRGLCRPHNNMARRAMQVCSIEGCDSSVLGRGWCAKHYKRWKRHGDPLAELSRQPNEGPCSVDGCDADSKARGWCLKHYQRWKKYGDSSIKLTLHGEVEGCLVDGCEAVHQANGYCDKHYRRLKKYGDPLKLMQPQGSDEERLLAKREIRDGHWLFTGSLNDKGYGRLWSNVKKDKEYVHILAYELWVGPIPEGKEIDHLCRVRNCFYPEHLEAVTPRENVMRGEGPAAINARKTECDNGHPFTEENTRRWTGKKGTEHRTCKVCHRERARLYRQRGTYDPETRMYRQPGRGE